MATIVNQHTETVSFEAVGETVFITLKRWNGQVQVIDLTRFEWDTLVSEFNQESE